ncbi:hypothetical protein RUM44_008313 [Polyplax serrata]|uniref:Uncharacterized protein n=1 Tax=Polyplax serrata TaxID=468196 RepID=A0ABR1B812_POLSC
MSSYAKMENRGIVSVIQTYYDAQTQNLLGGRRERQRVQESPTGCKMENTVFRRLMINARTPGYRVTTTPQTAMKIKEVDSRLIKLCHHATNTDAMLHVGETIWKNGGISPGPIQQELIVIWKTQNE